MTESMQLAYIIGTYPTITTTFIDREVRILQQIGASLQLVSIRRSTSTLSAEQRELYQNTIYLLPVHWLNFILGNFYFVLQRPSVYFKTLVYLLNRPHPSFGDRLKTLLHFAEGVYAAHLLHSQPPDHLHAHFIDRAATVALVAGRLLDIPYSVTAHANDIYVKKILLCEKITEASFVVTVSEFNKSHLLDTCPGLNPDKIHVLHPWIDVSHFQPPPPRPVSKTLHILSVGRLVEKKGHRYLIEACRLLQTMGIDFECRIIGSGPLKADLETEIKNYDLEKSVHLLGAQPQSKVLANLRWCDVFVLACVIAKDGDRDGMPVVLAEAMAMATPVVSCNIVGIAELVRPRAGLLVPPRNAKALAEALQSIYALSQSERAEIGRYGRSIIDAEFNLHKGTRHLMTLFQQSVNVNTNLESNS